MRAPQSGAALISPRTLPTPGVAPLLPATTRIDPLHAATAERADGPVGVNVRRPRGAINVPLV